MNTASFATSAQSPINLDQFDAITFHFDGNNNDNDQGFSSFKWDWLDSTNNPVLQEAREKMENTDGKVNDPSDAGMLFYAITGQETADPDDAKPSSINIRRPSNPLLTSTQFLQLNRHGHRPLSPSWRLTPHLRWL